MFSNVNDPQKSETENKIEILEENENENENENKKEIESNNQENKESLSEKFTKSIKEKEQMVKEVFYFIFLFILFFYFCYFIFCFFVFFVFLKISEIIKIPDPNLVIVDPKKEKNCFNCGYSFAFYSKKINCDTCKKVFCSGCCNKTTTLPLDYGHGISCHYKSGTLCDECFSIITLYKKKIREKEKKEKEEQEKNKK